jgi:hypothetical protein
MKCRAILILAFFLLLPTAPWADALDELFVAEAVVTDEGSETRNRVLGELLAEVLVRLSGDAEVAGEAAAREILADAPSLVRQYRYRSETRDGEVVRLLNARFDRDATERAMRAANLPVWTQRPRVLLWLAAERGGKRELLNLETETAARTAVLARARQRGMPLQLPLMDLEDRAQLTPADLWSQYRPGIELASARYPHQVVLAGRLTALRGGRWRGDWTLLDADGSRAFDTGAAPLTTTLEQAVDQSQRLLAERYAPAPAAVAAAGTLVFVDGVTDLAAYGRLVALFDSLDLAEASRLRMAWGDGLLFELELRGSGEQLRRVLAQAGMLAEQPPPLTPLPASAGAVAAAADTPPAADFYYRMVN